jgi:hypothetical protein
MRIKLLKKLLPCMLLPVLVLPPLFTTTSCSEEEKIVLTDSATTIDSTTKSPLVGMQPIHAMTNKNKAITDAVYTTDLTMPGCTFDSATGIFSGIPQESGEFVAHITAESPSHPTLQSNTLTITLNISEQKVSDFFVSAPHEIDLQRAVAMTNIQMTTKTNTNVQLTDAQYTVIDGTLPSGIQISNTGLISGTPAATTAGTSVKFKVTSTNYPGIEKERTINFVVAETNFTISGLSSNYDWVVGEPVNIQLEAVPPDGTTLTDVQFYLDSGTPLPSGIMMTSDGLIHGIPTLANNIASNITIQCMAKIGDASVNAISTSTSVVDSLPSQLPLRYLQPGMDLKGMEVDWPTTKPYPTPTDPDQHKKQEQILLNGSIGDEWVGFGAIYYGPPDGKIFECVFSQGQTPYYETFYSMGVPYGWNSSGSCTIPTDMSYIVPADVSQLNNFSSTF